MSAGFNEHVGEQFSKKLINVQVLYKSMEVGIFQKINKICCMIIKDTRVCTDTYKIVLYIAEVSFWNWGRGPVPHHFFGIFTK